VKRLGWFSRLLDRVEAGERYRLALEQIVHAERHGLDTAWVAQHHFDGDEGGLPSPFVFLTQVAGRTSRIRLGTGIVTLPLDNPVRVAEDSAVLDLLCGGRLEVGVGSGGTPSSFAAFGLDNAARGEIFANNLNILRTAWRGEPLGGGGNRLYPPATHLDGLMLSRTQPRPQGAEGASLADIQNPIIDAYLAALPAGVVPRIMGSRSVFVADDAAEARRLAEAGLRRFVARIRGAGRHAPEESLEAMIARYDAHIGTPEQVAASLAADATLERATEVAVQVHSADPPHPYILRSIELFATRVAPALGWR
jgi:alkanesulfonate monooxygenase SsuD/methylene tetrahydromethanopterin reductase-like flavin-dependent oxidoreductase (luciferase family)